MKNSKKNLYYRDSHSTSCILCVSQEMPFFFRDNINRSTSAGSHKSYEEKKVQQEKKYKLLNISFRKPVAKGKLC